MHLRQGRHGRLPSVSRRATATVAVAALAASCSSDGASRGEGAEPTTATATSSASVTPTGTPDPTETPADDPSLTFPTVPPTRPAALAAHLERAVATWQDRSAGQRKVRRAAEFHQLAVRAIASRPDRFRDRVLAHLEPRTQRIIGAEVRASRALGRLGEPQKRLPPWRVVAPPPPRELLRHYQRAERRTGVDWSYLAAIHLVETRMGRIRGTSTAGAQGPMQFLPTTWEIYGAGGDITDPRDAILAAARLLRANGAPEDMADALWHYNPSDSYVTAVSGYARNMRRSDAAYRSYWHWRVLYRHVRGTYVLPLGYPDKRPVLLAGQ